MSGAVERGFMSTFVVVGSVLGSFYACGFLADVWQMVQTSVNESKALRNQVGEN